MHYNRQLNFITVIIEFIFGIHSMGNSIYFTEYVQYRISKLLIYKSYTIVLNLIMLKPYYNYMRHALFILHKGYNN